MKRTLIAFFTIILVVTTVVLWVLLSEPQPERPNTFVNQDRPDEAKLEEVKTKAAAVKVAEALGDQGVLETAKQELAEAVGGRAGRMLQMAIDRNLPITMYGKVVDQYGKPVVGARVNLVIAGGGTFAPGTGLTSYVTDNEGKFKVEAKGQQIQVMRVKHPDLVTYITRHPSDGRVVRGKLLRAIDQFGEAHSWRTYNTPDNPYIIEAWRVERFEELKSGSGGYYPDPNGAASEKRGIVATCRREPKEPGKHWSKQKGSWSITFRPIRGGIQETDDLYLNQAPESDYQPELTVAMERGAPDYKTRIYPAKRYYYTAHGGKWYGSFSATFEPYMYDDHCRVNVKYKYNPNGSRNLALKPRY